MDRETKNSEPTAHMAGLAGSSRVGEAMWVTGWHKKIGRLTKALLCLLCNPGLDAISPDL